MARLREFGPNRLADQRKSPRWLMFVQGLTHFFAVILWIGAALAYLAEVLEPGQGMATIANTIVAVILINATFSFWQQYKAEMALESLQKLLPHCAQAVRDGAGVLVPIEDLVPGDLVDIVEGDIVPADCRITSTFGMWVNNAIITGESVAQFRDSEASVEGSAMAASNMVLAGTAVTSGKARALVVATGMHTELGRIAGLTQSTETPLSPLQKELAIVSRVIGIIALAMGVLFFIVGHWIGLSLLQNFIFAVGIIVANVPEGLLPTVTLCMAMAAQRMAKRNALVRHLPSVETLGSTTVICTDKTGTLTMNSMRVSKAYVDGSLRSAVDVSKSPSPAGELLLKTARCCHTLTVDGTDKQDGHTTPAIFGDAMEIALYEFSKCEKGDNSPAKIAVLPFDSLRRRLTVACATDDGEVEIFSKGALEAILPHCSYKLDDGVPLPLDEPTLQCTLRAERELAQSGLRVLAFSYRTISGASVGEPHLPLESLERDMTLLGLVALNDPPRPEVAEAIRQCRDAGIRVIMVTGDHPHTAVSIGAQIGMFSPTAVRVVTGEQLAAMSDVELQIVLGTPDLLFARTSAEQKARIVGVLRRKGETVAVTGDGVNDAPALRAADIGIAMGLGGADVARNASDVVLLDNNFATIVSAVEEGRTVYANIRKFMRYILTHEPPEILPYIAFVLMPVPLAITATQILLIDLGTDTVPGLALGAEAPSPDVMRQPPRKRGEHLVNLKLVVEAYFVYGLMEIAGAATVFVTVLLSGGWHYGDRLNAASVLYRQSTTAFLSAIVIMQIVNMILCRGNGRTVFQTNPLFAAGIWIPVLLVIAVNAFPPMQVLFATAPIPPPAWIAIAVVAGAFYLVGRIRSSRHR